MMRWIGRFLRDQRGQDMLEYSLMVAFMTVAGGAVLIPLTPSVSSLVSKVVSVLVHLGGA